MVATYRARRRIKLGPKSWREPGELVPEAHTWFRVESWAHTGWLEEVNVDEAELSAAIDQYLQGETADKVRQYAGLEGQHVALHRGPRPDYVPARRQPYAVGETPAVAATTPSQVEAYGKGTGMSQNDADRNEADRNDAGRGNNEQDLRFDTGNEDRMVNQATDDANLGGTDVDFDALANERAEIANDNEAAKPEPKDGAQLAEEQRDRDDQADGQADDQHEHRGQREQHEQREQHRVTRPAAKKAPAKKAPRSKD